MTARVVAVAAHRYEPDWMVDDLRENVAWCDDLILLDTRGDDRVWVPRVERVDRLLADALVAGADFVLYMDVDERIQDGAEPILRAIADAWRPGLPFAFRFRLRELYTADRYRIDGTWGRKTRRRFFHLPSRLADPDTRPEMLERPVLYHLKHIEPGNGERRAQLHDAHNTWDRAGRDGGEGFGYLADEDGAKFATVPAGHGYSPPHTRPFVFHVPGFHEDLAVAETTP